MVKNDRRRRVIVVIDQAQIFGCFGTLTLRCLCSQLSEGRGTPLHHRAPPAQQARSASVVGLEAVLRRLLLRKPPLLKRAFDRGKGKKVRIVSVEGHVHGCLGRRPARRARIVRILTVSGRAGLLAAPPAGRPVAAAAVEPDLVEPDRLFGLLQQRDLGLDFRFRCGVCGGGDLGNGNGHDELAGRVRVRVRVGDAEDNGGSGSGLVIVVQVVLAARLQLALVCKKFEGIENKTKTKLKLKLQRYCISSK